MRALITVGVVVIHTIGLLGRLPVALTYLPHTVVVLFFVHTSAVLCWSLERLRAFSPSHLWRRFMVRRAFRILPLSAAVLTAILIFRIPSELTPPDFHFLQLDAPDIVSNYLLVTNLTRSAPLLSPLWSLPYEFQMYLVLPALVVGLPPRRRVACSFALWGVTLTAAFLQPSIPHAGRFDVLQYLPCFVAGIISYALFPTARPRLPFCVWPLVLMVSMGLPVASVGCLLAACTAPFVCAAKSRLLIVPARWIARHSFAIYLAHYFCLWLAFRAGLATPALQWLVFAVSMMAIPAVLHRAIELPMMRWGRRLSDGSGWAHARLA